MAPPLNLSQTGTVPKNKPRSTQQQPQLARNRPTSNSFNVESCDNRYIQRRVYEQLPEIRWDVTGPRMQQEHVENGDVSWNDKDNEMNGHSGSSSRKSSQHSGQQWNSGPNVDNGPPDRRQVTSKLKQIQDYVKETQNLMKALKSQDTTRSKEQYDKLGVMLTDLQDSETKLTNLLRSMDQNEERIKQLIDAEHGEGSSSNMSQSAREEELKRKTEDSLRKLEAMQKKQGKLLLLQERAKQQLHAAQEERERLLMRQAAEIDWNNESSSNNQLEGNIQTLGQRLRNVQQIYNESNQIAFLLDDNKSGDEDEDHAELSDTETDLQSVQNKIEELNAMKEKLSQLRNVMSMLNHPAGVNVEQRINEEPAAASDAERKAESIRRKEIKLEKTKAKLSQLTDMLRVVTNVQNSTTGETIPPHVLQMISNLSEDDEDDSVSVSISPVASPTVQQQRQSDDATAEKINMMTRELEDQMQAMRHEQERLIETRRELHHLTSTLRNRNQQAANSIDSSARETPPRQLSVGVERAGSERSSPFVPQRTAWDNQSVAKSKNVERGLRSEEPRAGDEADMARPVTSSWNNLVETQSQLEHASSLCDRLMQDGNSLDANNRRPFNQDWAVMLQNQHQFLAKTLLQCAQMICMQQRQIQELRQALLMNQSMVRNQQLETVINSMNCAAATSNRTTNQADILQDPSVLLQQDMFNLLHNNCLQQQEHACTLNNQVPPGNRANNYWDNFRSYSRQNLLSNTKSNEDSSSASRRSLPVRERNSLEPTSLNNQLNLPNTSTQVTENDGGASGGLANGSQRQNHSQISSRSRSVDPQNLRTSQKNEASSSGVSAGAGAAASVGPVDLSGDVQVNNNIKRVDKVRSRNEARENLNNRSDINRSNIEERPDESLNVFENRTNNLDTTSRIDELFGQLRDNQNTIRHNMGTCESNLSREVNFRNLERVGWNNNSSGYKMPAGTSTGIEQYLTMNPKNVYVDVYDKLMGEMRRRNMLGKCPVDCECEISQSAAAAAVASGAAASGLDKANDTSEDEGAVGLSLENWGQNLLNTAAYNETVNFGLTNTRKTDFKPKLMIHSTDNGDLAEADQSRHESLQPDSVTSQRGFIEHGAVGGAAPESEVYYPTSVNNNLKCKSEGSDCSGSVKDNKISLNNCGDVNNDVDVLGGETEDDTHLEQHFSVVSISALDEEEAEPDLVSNRNTSPEAELGWEMENGLDQVPSRLQRGQDSPGTTQP